MAGRLEPGVQGFSLDGLCAYRQGRTAVSLAAPSGCVASYSALRRALVFSGVDRQFEFVAGLFGCGVDPDLVEEFGGQFTFRRCAQRVDIPG